MLNLKSSNQEILEHLEKLNLLLLDQQEINAINKIISIEPLLADNLVSSIIESDLLEENWLTSTIKVIEFCKLRKSKSNQLEKTIKNIRNFLCYRILEDFIRKDNLILIIDGSTVYFSNKKEQERKSKFFNKIFNSNVDSSFILKLNNIYLNNGFIDLTVIQKNKSALFDIRALLVSF